MPAVPLIHTRRRKWAALDPGVEELRGTILVGPTASGGTFEAATAPYLCSVIMDAVRSE